MVRERETARQQESKTTREDNARDTVRDTVREMARDVARDMARDMAYCMIQYEVHWRCQNHVSKNRPKQR